MSAPTAASATVLRSPWPDPEIPDVPFTEVALRRAAELPAQRALVDAASGRALTFGELPGLVRNAAAVLHACGLRQGDVLCLFAPNLPEWPVALHGALTLGAAVAPASPLYTPRELGAVLADSGARIVVTVPPFDAVALEAGADEVVTLAELLAPAGEEPPVVEIRPGDLAVLPYSSGTTGLPKGVELTHRNLVAQIGQNLAVLPSGPDHVALGLAPFFHAMGMTTVLGSALASGATLVCMPRFDPGAFLAAIQEHRVTQIIVPPPVLQFLARHPAVDGFDLSSLRWLGCGAAPADAELERAAAQRLGCIVGQGYGITEATATVSVSAPTEPEKIRPGSVGRLLPGTEAMVIDSLDGRPLPRGEAGELLIRGPQVSRGYLCKPDATAATFDEAGWLHTGDLARFDDDGHLWILDRLKELIKVKAYQVAPAELEGLLATHPAVADAAVIGVPDPDAGEAPKAFVVARGELDPEELKAWIAERVAPYKRLRHVELIDAIPKSPTGKILRRVLRERG